MSLVMRVTNDSGAPSCPPKNISELWGVVFMLLILSTACPLFAFVIRRGISYIDQKYPDRRAEYEAKIEAVGAAARKVDKILRVAESVVCVFGVLPLAIAMSALFFGVWLIVATGFALLYKDPRCP